MKPGLQHTAAEKLLALAILMVLVAVFLLVTVGAGYRSFDRERHVSESVARTIARMEQALERQSGVIRGLENLDQRALENLVYVPGTTVAMTVANLQEDITRMANRTNAAVRRVIVSDGDASDGEISIQIQLSGTLSELSSFLVAAETAKPLLRIEAMNISGVRSRARTSRGSEDVFAGSFTISAYTKPGEPSDG